MKLPIRVNKGYLARAWEDAPMRAKQVSILLTIIAIILWCYSLLQPKLYINLFGLGPPLPLSFCLIFPILVTASAILWHSRESHHRLLCLQAALLIIGLALTPQLIWGSDRGIEFAYHNWFFTDAITDTGHINPAAAGLTYQEWPANFVLLSSLAQIAGLDKPEILATYAHVIILFILFLLLYPFFKNTLSEGQNYLWVGILIFLMGTWAKSDFVPQILGFFLLLTVLMLLSKSVNRMEDFSYSSVFILCLVALTTTHYLTAIAGLATFCGLYVVRKGKGLNLILFAAAFILAWTVYHATTHFEGSFSGFLEAAFRLDLLWQTQVAEHTGVSQAHLVIVKLKLLSIILLCAIASLGFILSLASSKQKFWFRKDILAIAVSYIIIGIAVTPGYGWEGADRIFILLLPFIGYFGAKLLNIKLASVALCLALIFLSFLYLGSFYGANSAATRLSSPYVDALHSFEDNTSEGGYVAGTSPLTHVWYPQKQQLFGYDALQWQSDRLTSINEGSLVYIWISQHDKEKYTHWGSKPQFVDQLQEHLRKTTNCNLIYANKDVTIYVNEPEKAAEEWGKALFQTAREPGAKS